MTNVPTGIAPLDAFLDGGLPEGYTTLLLAPPGAGAEIFAKEFAAGDPDGRTVYITTDESEKEVRETAQRADWPFSHVEIVDVQSKFADQALDMQKQLRTQARARVPSQSFDPRTLLEGAESTPYEPPRRRSTSVPEAPTTYDYLGSLLDPYSEEHPPARMVVHSLDFYLNMYPLEKAVAALTALKAANARAGGQMLWVLSAGGHGGTVERRVELLGDCLIEFEMTRKGTKFERFCIIKKVKNRGTSHGVSTYELTNRGFHLENLERIV